MTERFVHLRLHSEFSLVDGAVRIPALVQRCAEYGMPAVAVTDLCNLFGLVKFYRQAINQGIKPIVGAELRIRNPEEDDRPYALVLLCQNMDGYRNLTRIVTRSFLEGHYRGLPQTDRDWLERANSGGLIALSCGLQGDIGRAIAAGHPERAAALHSCGRVP